jgi:hypothetical protein
MYFVAEKKIQEEFFFLSIIETGNTPPLLLLADIGKASSCYTQRGKSKEGNHYDCVSFGGGKVGPI